MIAVLLSGGMDSAAALYLAVERRGRENVRAVFVDYGQLALKRERDASWKLANGVGVPWISERAYVHGGSIAGFGGELAGPDTVVPGRNERFINAARLSAEEVWYSPHSGDWSVYEDCRPEFVRSFPFPVVAPFLYLMKRDIRLIGDRLGVPWELTWSCYAPVGGELPCGKCGACMERAAALGLAPPEGG